MAKIKVGVFGAGRGMTMINFMRRYPEAELVAVCDKYEPYREKVQRAAAESGAKVAYYTDFDKFFEHDMDAVVLANYANEHAPYAIRLLNSGRHVASEVLPTETMGQAVELVEAVERSGKVYAYAENYCYFPGTAEMKRRYRNGDIGEFTHGEGEYVHDCSGIWPDITYGERNHWRNNMFSTFYCTHSLGPVLNITGTRPVRVVGFETPNAEYMANVGGRCGSSAMILLQMDNGATVKSLHGNLKREPSSIWYSIYGKKGMMETDRWDGGTGRLHVFIEGDPLTPNAVSYRPRPRVVSSLAESISGHGGSDFYTMYYFLEKILGRPDGEEAIDIYRALDMSIPGLLAYRSICNGNVPYDVPDFRDKAQRDKYRGDNWCTNPAVAGDNLAPCCSFKSPEIPDEVYQSVRKMYEDRIK